MTEYEKQKIFELRTQGTGYKSIAALLGLTRDVVRGYCKRCGLDGSAEVIQKNIELRQKNGVICALCGKPINQPKRGRARRFCSEECRRSWWKAHPEKAIPKNTAMYKCVCAYCKKEFMSYGNKNRKFCSHDCYIKFRFKGANEND